MEFEVSFDVGNYVRIKEQGAIGQVVRLNKTKVVIAINHLLFYLPTQVVEKVEKLPSNCMQKKHTKPINFELSKSSQVQSTTLDLHGLSKAQALLALDKFIDHSLILGQYQLKIIHGKGLGILRNAIRNYLQEHALVKKVIMQSPTYHMAGITIIEL